jgi:hypothetical protein
MSLPSTETPDHLKRLTGDGAWSGCLTLENLDLVADRIRRLLENQRFTWVSCNQVMSNYFPEVRTGQRLAEGVKVTRVAPDGGREVGYITISYSAYVAPLDTDISDRAEANTLTYTEKRTRGPYLCFTHDRVEIDHFIEPGSRAYWVAAVEEPDGMNL